MSIQALIAQFGYPALLLGTLLEGETILLVAAFLAHRGYLEIGWVMAVGALGAYISDQTFFHIGRLRGEGVVGRFLTHRPHWHARVQRTEGLLRRHQTLVILGFRFLYGLRTVTPFAIGMSGIKTGRFMLLDAIATSTWSILVSLLGYAFGAAVEDVLARAKHYELWIALGTLAIAGSVTLWRWWRQSR